MQPVAVIDLVGMSAALVALAVMCLRWKQAFPEDVKLLLMGALLFTAAHAGVSGLAYIEQAADLAVPSNYLQLLPPLFWGMFFYAFFQSTIRHDLRHSEQHFRELWDEAPAAYHMVDTDGILVRVNHTELDMLGYSEEEMLGRPVFDFTVPEQREEAEKEFRRRIEGEIVPKSTERLFVRKDGTRLPVTIDYRLGYDHNGNVVGARSTMVSTLEETRLREELKTLFEYNPVPTVVVDERGRVTRFNCAKRESADGLPRIGDLMYLDYHGEHEIDMRGRLLDCIESGEPKRFQDVPYKDRFLSITMAPMPEGAIIVTQDVTRQKRTEQALREGQKRLRMLAETVPDAISLCEWNPETNQRKLIFCNERFVEMSGFSREVLESADDLNELIVDHRTQEEIERAEEHIRQGKAYNGVASWKRPDGEESFYEWSVTPVKVGEKYHLFGVDRDLTEMARMERALERTQEQFRSVLESVRDVAYKVHRRHGAFSYISPNVEDLLGFPAAEVINLRAKGLIDSIHPDDVETFRNATRRLLRDPEAEPMASLVEYRLRRRDDEYVWVSDSRRVIRTEDGTPEALVGTLRDISRRKETEREKRRFHARMQEAQRLESLGVLAGGMAHDFNNLLTGVIGNADLALMSLPEDSGAHQNLQEIQASAQEAAELAEQILAYAGEGKFVIEPVQLDELIDEIRPLLQAALPGEAALQVDCSQDVVPFEGDPDQIKQVILNLVTNAAEAVGDGAGNVTVTVSRMEPDESFFEDASLRGDTSAEDYACLEVVDDGPGMDGATLQRIFEPFFTTRFMGRGLGLAAALGIVRAHGGSIRVRSRPGEGTSVQVLFPAVAPSEMVERKQAPVEDLPDDCAGEEGLTALVMALDPDIGAVAGRTLENAGFRVVRTSDKNETRRVLETDEDRVGLVMVDLPADGTPPDVVLRELRKAAGRAPFIVSGDSPPHPAVRKLADTGELHLLQKPYSPGRLTAMVRELLSPVG